MNPNTYNQNIISFNKNRKYYSGPNIQDRIQTYKNNCYELSKFNNLISPVTDEDDKKLRILSWNIRYWTDCDDIITINKQVEVINAIAPDIICLQEITLGYNKYYDDSAKQSMFNESYLNLLNNYMVISVCTSVPSWYADSYGNMILISKKYHAFAQKFEHIFNEEICGNQKKCFFNQMIQSYQGVPEKHIRQRNDIDIQYNDNSNEIKCFIKISVFEFDIFCVHLDAYRSDYRIKQLNQINENITRLSFIVGDYNFIDYNELNTKESKDELQYHEQFHSKKLYNISENVEYNYVTNVLKWNDLAKLFENVVPNFSQWSGTRVDHVFIADPMKELNKKGKRDWVIKMFFYGTSVSDHLPIIVDVNGNDRVGMKLHDRRTIIHSISNVVPENMTIENFIRQIGIDNKTIYNGQPITVYDWIINGKFNINKYGKNDPYMLGNSGGDFGINGIYAAGTFEGAFNFGYMIMKKYLSDKIPIIIFEFKIIANDMDMITVVARKGGMQSITLETDKETDVIFGSSLGIRIMKFTPRTINEYGISKFIKCNGFHIIINLSDVQSDFIEEKHNKYYTFITSKGHSDELSTKLAISFGILEEWIDKLNKNMVPTILFDMEKVKITDRNIQFFVPITEQFSNAINMLDTINILQSRKHIIDNLLLQLK